MHKYSVQRTLESFWWWLAQSGQVRSVTFVRAGAAAVLHMHMQG